MSLYYLAYGFIVYFLLRILYNQGMIDEFSAKRKALILISCFIMPAIFFAPYLLNLHAKILVIPDFVFWLPFLIMAASILFCRFFYPKKTLMVTHFIIKLSLAWLILINCLPLMLGLIERYVIRWIH